MQDRIVGVLWPTKQNYARFVTIFGTDDYPEAFINFVQMAVTRLAAQGIDLAHVERVEAEPEEVRDWCLRHHGNIQTEARALFVLFKLRSRHGKGADAIN